MPVHYDEMSSELAWPGKNILTVANTAHLPRWNCKVLSLPPCARLAGMGDIKSCKAALSSSGDFRCESCETSNRRVLGTRPIEY